MRPAAEPNASSNSEYSGISERFFGAMAHDETGLNGPDVKVRGSDSSVYILLFDEIRDQWGS